MAKPARELTKKGAMAWRRARCHMMTRLLKNAELQCKKLL